MENSGECKCEVERDIECLKKEIFRFARDVKGHIERNYRYLGIRDV